MNTFMEWLPLLSGAVVGLLMARQSNRRVKMYLWLGLSIGLGFLINQLNGESLAWVAVDVSFVAISALIVSIVHRFIIVR